MRVIWDSINHPRNISVMFFNKIPSTKILSVSLTPYISRSPFLNLIFLSHKRSIYNRGDTGSTVCGTLSIKGLKMEIRNDSILSISYQAYSPALWLCRADRWKCTSNENIRCLHWWLYRHLFCIRGKCLTGSVRKIATSCQKMILRTVQRLAVGDWLLFFQTCR